MGVGSYTGRGEANALSKGRDKAGICTKRWGRLPCGQSDGHMTENITFLQLRCRAVKLNDQNYQLIKKLM